MSKRFLALAMAILVLFITGCQPGNNNENNSGSNNGSENNNQGGGETESGEFVFKGVVTSTDNNRYIEMEVIDSDIASGIYWVLVNEQTQFVNKSGNPIARALVKVGDTIAVSFSGQVMMSYPPRIAAQKITRL